MDKNDDLRVKCRKICALSNGKLKLKDIATYIGVSKSSFYNYMSGGYEIKRSKKEKIIALLDAFEKMYRTCVDEFK